MSKLSVIFLLPAFQNKYHCLDWSSFILHLAPCTYPVVMVTVGAARTYQPFPSFGFCFQLLLSEGVATFQPSPLRNYSPNDASFVGPFFSLLALVPCKIVLASPDDLDTCPNHFYLRFYTVVKISLSWGPMAYLILSVAASLVMWSLYERPSSMFPKASHLSDLQFLQDVRCQCPAGVQQY